MGIFKRQNYKAAKFDGDFIFSDFSYGLYNLDIPRSLPEQLSSLALTGGRNVWTEKGALCSQYGYDTKSQFDIGDIPYLVSSDNNQANNIFIICTNDIVYHYTTLEGLKKYKTKLTDITNPIIAHSGSNLYIVSGASAYIFGGCYNTAQDATATDILERAAAAIKLGSKLYINITEEEYKYFWLDKNLVFKITGEDNYIETFVLAGYPNNTDETYPYTIELNVSTDLVFNGLTDTVRLYEKALHALNYNTSAENPEFVWVNEEGTITPEIANRKILPKLMAVALNRLWIVDEDNTIFYSAVGNMTSFDQANGAGYFRGFYEDTSEVLSLEEFYSGILITKQTGMYHVRLTTSQYSYTSGQGTIIAQSSNENYISIEKVNNITQKYPGDHVIIGSEVIAFDSSSGNLIQAAYVNYMGNIQEGGVLLHGSELDAQSLGIMSSVNRELAYSFQEETLLLYYGKTLDKALLITRGLSLYPRETNKEFLTVKMFAQGFINVTLDGYVIEDFKRGTIIPDLSPIAEFEPIALRGNKLLNGSIIEITELNGVRYTISTLNSGSSEQAVTPVISQITKDVALPNLIYSDLSRNFLPASFAEETKWANQKSNVTRLYAPLSGRDGLRMSIEFEPNTSFCFAAIRFPEMSQGE